jgi:hypothetical protein
MNVYSMYSMLTISYEAHIPRTLQSRSQQLILGNSASYAEWPCQGTCQDVRASSVNGVAAVGPCHHGMMRRLRMLLHGKSCGVCACAV